MNKQQVISSVQSLLNSGRMVITELHRSVNVWKENKKFYDEAGDLEAEYFYHNMLQKQRAILKKEIKNQKALKTILKDLQHG